MTWNEVEDGQWARIVGGVCDGCVFAKYRTLDSRPGDGHVVIRPSDDWCISVNITMCRADCGSKLEILTPEEVMEMRLTI